MPKQLDWEQKIDAHQQELHKTIDALVAAGRLALGGLRYLADHSEIPAITADAQMAANTLEAAIKKSERL